MSALSAEIRAAVEAAIAPIADEIRQLRAEIDRRDRSEFVSQSQLAEMLNVSPKALSMRLARGSELAGIAVRVDGRRTWRRADVEALIARGAK